MATLLSLGESEDTAFHIKYEIPHPRRKQELPLALDPLLRLE